MAMAVTREALLEQWEQPAFWRCLTIEDGLWMLLAATGSILVWWLYRSYMDGYEIAIQAGSTLALIAWGCTGNRCDCLLWQWRC